MSEDRRRGGEVSEGWNQETMTTYLSNLFEDINTAVAQKDATIDALRAENERLKLELFQTALSATEFDQIERTEAERDALRAECERLREQVRQAYEDGQANGHADWSGQLMESLPDDIDAHSVVAVSEYIDTLLAENEELWERVYVYERKGGQGEK